MRDVCNERGVETSAWGYITATQGKRKEGETAEKARARCMAAREVGKGKEASKREDGPVLYLDWRAPVEATVRLTLDVGPVAGSEALEPLQQGVCLLARPRHAAARLRLPSRCLLGWSGCFGRSSLAKDHLVRTRCNMLHGRIPDAQPRHSRIEATSCRGDGPSSLESEILVISRRCHQQPPPCSW